MLRTAIASLFFVSAMAFAAAPSLAQDPRSGTGADAGLGEADESSVSEDVWTAVDAVADIAGDQQKLASYCAIAKEIAAADAAGNEAGVEAAEGRMRTYLEGLGEDFVYAWELGGEIDVESEGGKVLEEAFGDLDDQCGA